MRNENRYRNYSITCMIVALCLGAVSSHGAVTADPANLTFVSPGQSFAIDLANGGPPSPPVIFAGGNFWPVGTTTSI